MNINVNSGALCRGQGLQDSPGTMTVTVASHKSKNAMIGQIKTSNSIYFHSRTRSLLFSGGFDFFLKAKMASVINTNE